MNKPHDLLIPGAAIGGGFFSHRLSLHNTLFGVIIAPKALGHFPGVIWNKSVKNVAGALSYVDGRQNTLAMAEAGSKIAEQVLALRIDGIDGWHIPARDELEPAYRILKPTKDENYGYYRSGENPTTGTYGYTPDDPRQTEVEAFRVGGPEAFEAGWYWTSTQRASDPGCAWVQGFGNGDQSGSRKSDRYLVRAVRLIEL